MKTELIGNFGKYSSIVLLLSLLAAGCGDLVNSQSLETPTTPNPIIKPTKPTFTPIATATKDNRPPTKIPVPPTPTFLPTITPALYQPILDSTNTKTEATVSEISKYLSLYKATALRNIVKFPDGRKAIIPSPAYAGEMYSRDAFYSALGLGDTDLSRSFYSWFEKTQDHQTGQIASVVSLTKNESMKPQNDESTLLFIIWSYILNKQGIPVREDVVKKAYEFVQSNVHEGAYISQPGPFRYWVDNLKVQTPDIISYNQGLYLVALEALYRMGLRGVFPDLIQQAKQQAKNQYLRLYNRELGFVPQSQNTTYLDISALFPEVLYRYLFDLSGDILMPNQLILQTLEAHLRMASVLSFDGRLIGIKNLVQKTGDNLPKEKFSVTALADPGDYQNGAYWPMYTLSQLVLAYRISGESRYLSMVMQLLREELGDDRSNEYIRLDGKPTDPLRSDYSWNVLLAPIANWGITK